MPLSPLLPEVDEDIDKFYVQPKMTVSRINKRISGSSLFKGKEVSSISQVLKNRKVKNIYIQGNIGIGKTTYSKKITLDWCKHIEQIHAIPKDEKDNENCNVTTACDGIDFDFLFHINLKENDNESDVKQMIEKNIISQMSYLHIHKYDDIFLSTILDKERCFFILDGFDEWTHPETESYKPSQGAIPDRCTGDRCVYLTLARPWKLNQVSLKDSEIDVLIEITGVENPNDLVRKVINSLNNEECEEEKQRNADEFILATTHLTDLKTNPMIAILLVCVWYESLRLPESLCGIYTTMVKMFLNTNKTDIGQESDRTSHTLPKCFGSFEWSALEITILDHLGKLAFETLFPKDSSNKQIVFSKNTVHNCLKNLKEICLSAGLLTEYKIHVYNKRCSQFSFIHETIQEFLAVFHLAFHVEQQSDFFTRIKFDDGITYEFSRLFRFFCGLNPLMANSVSLHFRQKVEQLIVTWALSSTCSVWFRPVQQFVIALQNMLNDGYKESIQGEQTDFSLNLNHVCYSKDLILNTVVQPVEDLTQMNKGKIDTVFWDHGEFCQAVFDIIKSNSNSIKNMFVNAVRETANLNSCSNLQLLEIAENVNTSEINLDLSECKSLKHLGISQENLKLNLDTDKLLYCALACHNLSHGNIATILQASRQLRFLRLRNCSVDKRNKTFCLDLSACSNLEMFYVERSNFTIGLNATNLRECHVKNYDLSIGNITDILNHAVSLEKLLLERCKSSPANFSGVEGLCLDVTKCTRLKTVEICSCANNVIIYTANVRKLILTNYDISQGNILEVIMHSQSLKSLKLAHCTVGQKRVYYKQVVYVDLTECTGLEKLEIKQCAFSVIVKPSNLKSLSLTDYDLLQGDVARALNAAYSLLDLTLKSCIISSTTEESRYGLDLTACRSLEKLIIDDCKFYVTVSTTYLHESYLTRYDLSKGNVLEVLQNSKLLSSLELLNCKTAMERADSRQNDNLEFDLTACCSLEILTISKTDISVNISKPRLRQCRLHKYNFSQGNLFEILTNSTELQIIELVNCYFLSSNQIDRNKQCIDISQCKDICKIVVVDSDVLVAFHKWIIGTEEESFLLTDSGNRNVQCISSLRS